MMLARAFALFPLLVSAEACATSGVHCSLLNGCCGSLHCKPHGLLTWRCAEQCVAEGQTCGGPGLADSTCCDGMRCERHLLGTSNKQCVKPQPQCVAQGQICGCTGCRTQHCCGGSTCSEVLRQGGKRYCIDSRMAGMGEAQALDSERNSTVLVQQEEQQHHHECVAEGQTCGGPGLAESTCCDGMRCERHLLGTSNKQCVKPQPQCVAEGQTCGGPGLTDGTCCDGMRCERHLLGTSNKQCVKPQPQCMEQGQICGCTGCRTQHCCGGSTCSEVMGQGGKQYCIDARMAGMGEAQSLDAAEKNDTALVLLP